MRFESHPASVQEKRVCLRLLSQFCQCVRIAPPAAATQLHRQREGSDELHTQIAVRISPLEPSFRAFAVGCKSNKLAVDGK